MFDFPITISIQDKLVVVVGYGSVGKRKVEAFLSGGARVRVVDPAIDPSADQIEIADPLLEGVEVRCRDFDSSDLDDAYLVCIAVGDSVVEDEVVAVARRAGILVNVAGNPEKGDFALPALIRRESLKVAVSTDGKSPAAAVAVRDVIADMIGPELGELIEVIAQLRGDRLTVGRSFEYNCRILSQLTESDLLELILDKNHDGVAAMLARLKQ